MTAGAGFGRDHGRDIGVGALDTLTLAGHGRIFCHHMAVVAGDTGMAHAAGFPTLHDTGHLFSMAFDAAQGLLGEASRSEEHTSELQSHSFISYAVFCLKKKKSITYPHLLRLLSTLTYVHRHTPY